MNLLPANKKDLEARGFPEEIQAAFLNTARETQCVVLSRVPGAAATELIRAGHDLKGFFIKAKSCDWGPMAGFLCQVPAFSKKGVGGIEHNTKENLHYYDAFRDRLRSPVEGPAASQAKDRVGDVVTRHLGPSSGLRALSGDDSPFVPLKVKVVRTPEKEYAESVGNLVYGVAYKQDGPKKFVWFEYIARKSGDLYELYHGQVYVYSGTVLQPLYEYMSSTLKHDRTELATLGVPHPGASLPGQQTIEELCGTPARAETVQGRLRVLRQKLPLKPESRDAGTEAPALFYPINGIQNYYPPFSGKEAYKNAVTGDYDLFACWPKIPPSGGLGDLTRVSELERTNAPFVPMAWKPKALQSTVSQNVFVEFVPTYRELKELTHADYGHPSFGNANSLVLLVAGTLNSFVNCRKPEAESPKTQRGRNVAFHSDECGRSEIDEVEYDVAAFVPLAVMKSAGEKLGKDTAHPQMFILKNHVELLTLIHVVKPVCYVPLNFAWVYDFVKHKRDRDQATTDDVKKLVMELFCAPPKRDEEPEKAARRREEEYLVLQRTLDGLFQKGNCADPSFLWDAARKIDYFLKSGWVV